MPAALVPASTRQPAEELDQVAIDEARPFSPIPGAGHLLPRLWEVLRVRDAYRLTDELDRPDSRRLRHRVDVIV
jgi:hypothetical protein